MELTGSSYTGESRYGRIEGSGTYTLPTGTKYVGSFCDGTFHGDGVLHFPNGGRYVGKWVKGKVTEGKYIFPDQLEYKDSWDYCDGYDRRFHTEIIEGLNSSRHISLTNLETTRTIPPGCYDCGDGFYNPEEHIVIDYEKEYLRYADEDESNWIVSKCRKEKDEYVSCPTDG